MPDPAELMIFNPPLNQWLPAGGYSVYTGSIGATGTAVKADGGSVYGWMIDNPNATFAYVQFFNALVGNVSLGTTAPFLSLGIPASGYVAREFVGGIPFSGAIAVACTLTRTGSGAPANTVDLNILYK